MIKLYNTLTAKKEEFAPLNGKSVSLYVCGVTPYDEVHLGHARAYVTFDIIRRHLSNSGFSVKHIQNFTDIDDKIINRAAELGRSPRDISEQYIKSYFDEIDKLHVLRADLYPKVTENIPEIISFIEELITKRAAYVVDGDVYYSVKSFSAYGKLSKRSTDDLKSGARVSIDERKNDPLDFALWKKSKETEPDEVKFSSPWGKGRPGWHIECSVMSGNNLGATLDIHGGGQDLIFPHHENEIAQSEAKTGKPFAKYWVHNGFVTINKEKMSKSLGNFFTLKDIFKSYEPMTVRYFLISQNYHSPLDFSEERLKESWVTLENLTDTLSRAGISGTKNGFIPGSETSKIAYSKFLEALDDDFNTEKAISIIHELKKSMLQMISSGKPDTNALHDMGWTLLMMLDKHLGIQLSPASQANPEAVSLQKQRELARKSKEWKKSDELRDQLKQLGYLVEDNPDGTSRLLKARP